MVGGDGKDRIDGGDGADEVYGEAGNDTVVAGAGDDYVEGDDDHDSLEGGAGDDLLGGGDGADKLDGGEGEDEIYGDEGNDQLIGGAGNDSLDGGAGSDKMAGGAGDDAYFVDAKKDSITETAENGTADAVISSVDYTLGKYVEILFLYGDTGLTGKGNAADNDIVGSDNDDALYGKGGNDLIEGGGGNDCFYFDVKPDASTNVDDIVDFVSGEDALYLAKKIFSAYKTTGTVAPTDLATFDSSAGGTLTSAAGSSTRFLYDSAGGDLYYDKDGSGALVAVKFATLVGTPPLVASDLVLV
jgi:Ca2+-binding RTX toxin-like protein